MHPLINEDMVENIRNTGNAAADLPPRVEILEKHGLPYDREAENVIVTGCQILYLLPQVLSSLARVLQRGDSSYTFLSREYCCGNYLYRPAIKARDEAAMAGCRELSREFVDLNLSAARELGAKRLVIFCSPCYPIYKHAFPQEDIVFYPVAIAGAMGNGFLDAATGGLFGILIGSWLLAAIYPRLREGILKKGDFKDITLPKLLKVNDWVVIVPLAIILIAAMYFMEASGV